MPILSMPLDADGAIVDLLIGVSDTRAAALRVAGLPVPGAVQVRALVDTGASCTAVIASVLLPFELAPIGNTTISTPSTGPAPVTCNQYDVSLGLIHPQVTLRFGAMGVVECQALSPPGIQALLGRDLLAHCLLVYDGLSQRFSLAF